ncbi:hypothetical protein [Cognatilysobacter segetis]|uniref:hypothetical protein n=1 Tax=Cognatilysobacter segetis TaxID=2492394 RepID=UPI0010615EC6|nr:hypothetical protein [Lysobacter segetis]
MSTKAPTAVSILDEILCTASAIGLVLVALLPGARGMSPVGWLPMWLVAMPALSWWALHGFALPYRRADADAGADGAALRGVRRALPQARRSARPARRRDARRAA